MNDPSERFIAAVCVGLKKKEYIFPLFNTGEHGALGMPSESTSPWNVTKVS